MKVNRREEALKAAEALERFWSIGLQNTLKLAA